LKVTAIQDPDLFREIFDYCLGLYEEEKKTYHVSADVNKLRPAKQFTDDELVQIFYDETARQVLHVTFGRVLTDKLPNGDFKFKNRLFDCLADNEATHYEILIKHFNKHMEPFN
jgi:hypothetical protein